MDIPIRQNWSATLYNNKMLNSNVNKMTGSLPGSNKKTDKRDLWV